MMHKHHTLALCATSSPCQADKWCDRHHEGRGAVQDSRHQQGFLETLGRERCLSRKGYVTHCTLGCSMESKPKLLDQMRQVMRLKHMSIRTEETYVSWAKRFILFHQKRYPHTMGADEIRAFLSHLATEGHVAASTQNVTLNALVFLYRSVLKQDFPDLGSIEQA